MRMETPRIGKTAKCRAKLPQTDFGVNLNPPGYSVFPNRRLYQLARSVMRLHRKGGIWRECSRVQP